MHPVCSLQSAFCTDRLFSLRFFGRLKESSEQNWPFETITTDPQKKKKTAAIQIFLSKKNNKARNSKCAWNEITILKKRGKVHLKMLKLAVTEWCHDEGWLKFLRIKVLLLLQKEKVTSQFPHSQLTVFLRIYSIHIQRFVFTNSINRLNKN